MMAPRFSEALERAMVAKALRDLRSVPPRLTNALFIALGVRTFDELAAHQAEHALEAIAALAGRDGRPTLDQLERCAAEGSDEGLDLLFYRLVCNADVRLPGMLVDPTRPRSKGPAS